MRALLAGLQQLFQQPFGQQLHAVGEEAEHKLIDEMRHRLTVGVSLLQRVGNALELLRRLGGDHRSRAGRL